MNFVKPMKYDGKNWVYFVLLVSTKHFGNINWFLLPL